MQYILLIYEDQKIVPAMSEKDSQAFMSAYFGYTEQLHKDGVHVAGEALQGTDAATSVQVRDGKRVTTDGPFAETKEALGGFYIVDCENLDAALKYAEQIPSAKHGTVEVRPIMVFDK